MPARCCMFEDAALVASQPSNIYNAPVVKAHRFEALDAWRGICALLVALEHLNTSSVLHQNGLTLHAYRFVDFFFVLSGFVIAYAYGERIQRDRTVARPFLIRRVGRLWPLHVTMLAALVAVMCALALAARLGLALGHFASLDKNTLSALPLNILLVHGWGFFDHLTWNGPSWSISTELFAYLLFAALCAFAPARITTWVCATLMVVSALVVALLAPAGMRSTFDFGVPRCVYGFMAGVLVCRAWGRYAPRLGTIGEGAVVIAVVVAVAWLPVDGWPALLVTPLFAITVWVFASENGQLSRTLRRKWPQVIGAWSYSIYMVHALMVVGLLTAAVIASKHGWHVFARVDGVAMLVGPAVFTMALTIGYVGLVLLVSRVTYRYIELPGQRRFGRWAIPAVPMVVSRARA
jgi:peptidoglycan/LPS O-acetylase OafA/YrhL